MAAKRDYYEVLGVAKDADEETLKTAFRKLVMKYHPDRSGDDPEALAKYKEAAEAFEVLKDPDKRARYDRYGHAGLEGMPSHEFQSAEDVLDLFGDLFGGLFGGGRRRRGPRHGANLQTEFEIDLVEAYHGTKRELIIPRQERCGDCSGSGAKPGTQPQPCRQCNGRGVVLMSQSFVRIQQTCPACRGQGSVIVDPCQKCRGRGAVAIERKLTVSVPPGIDEGMVLEVKGEGEAGDPGAPPGDLHCLVHVRPHKIFVRDGRDLHCEMPNTFAQAALGGTIEIPTLEGTCINGTLQKGAQAGDEIRIPGKGMPHVHRGRPGDLVVHLRVVTPRNLTKRQEELFRELAELDGAEGPPERKGFLDRVKDFFSSLATPKEEGAGESKRS
jgi:molecular chaperone DnaJ